MEREERQDKGIGAWGGRMPQPPLKSPRKVESSLGFSSGRFARHGSCCDSLFQWDPCPSVDGRQFRGFCPPNITPLWNFGSSWLKAPSRDQMVMDLFTGVDHSGESQGIFPPFMIGFSTTSPRFSPNPQATRYGERPGSPTRMQLIIYHTRVDK